MGGSFGGYMANWVAGHTDRFRAIVTHASLWALDQFGPTTDAAYFWAREMTEAMAHENSPHRFAESIVTPMLVIHGDKDYRVPIGEGLRLWWDLCSRAEDPATIVLRQQTGMRRARQVDTVEAALVGACDGELPVGAILDAENQFALFIPAGFAHGFITLAEATGLIGPLGEWSLKEACTQVKALRDRGSRSRAARSSFSATSPRPSVSAMALRLFTAVTVSACTSRHTWSLASLP